MEGMEQRFVAFIDLLGFKESLKHPTQAVSFLINSIASMNAAEGSKINKTTSGYNLELHPEISSFSDHVVVSHKNPEEDLPFLQSLILQDIARKVAVFFDTAITSNYLIRGGISFGDMKHSQNIVFGQALIDAVAAEENLALYPRIILHQSTINKLDSLEFHRLLWGDTIFQDQDGIFYINWLGTPLYVLCIDPNHNFSDLYVERLLIYKTIIEQNLRSYKADQKIYAKWHWLASHYNKNALFEQRDPAIRERIPLIDLITASPLSS